MSIFVNKETLDKAQSFLDQGKVHEAWQVLGNAGDNYAINAAKITDKNNDSLAKTLVRETWENTVGMAKYNEKFEAVAEDHLTNYLQSIRDLNEHLPPEKDIFVLPKTGDIEKSYAKALNDNGVSNKAAIDGIINTAFSGAGLLGWTSWLDLFDGKWNNDHDIEQSRISEDLELKSDYSRLEAAVKIAKIGIEPVNSQSGFQADWETVSDYFKGLYGDSKSFLQNLFSKQIEDQQSNLLPNQIDNSFLNLDIRTDKLQGFSSSNNSLGQRGTVIGDSDWELDIPTINNNGLKNVVPGGIGSDWIRPGNQELSEFDNFANQIKSDIDRMGRELRGDYSSTLNFKIQASTIDLTNAAIGARNFLNIDPVVLDLNGDGVKLTINTDPTSNFRPNNNAMQTGNVIDGGNYTLSGPINNINGDGAKNIIPWGIAADQNNVARQTIYPYQNFSTDLRVDLSKFDSFSNQINNNPLNNYLNFQIQVPIINLANQSINARSFLNIDPLVLDLNGDGVKLTSYQDLNVSFDVDNDNKLERTCWVSKEDGILVDDQNHDGKINNIRSFA